MKRSRGGVSINPAFCLSSASREKVLPRVPSQMGHRRMSHPEWDSLGNKEAPRSWLLLPGCREEGCGGRRGKSERHSKQGMGGFLEKQGVCSKPWRQQTERAHPRGEGAAWATAVHKTHQSCSAENKPLGNIPLLQELGRGGGVMCACFQALL